MSVGWETPEEQTAAVGWALAVMAATAEAGFPCYVALNNDDDGCTYWWCNVDELRASEDDDFQAESWAALHRAIALCESVRPECVVLSQAALKVVLGLRDPDEGCEPE